MVILATVSDIRDIKPPVYFPANYIFFLVIVGGILCAALIFLARFFAKKISERRKLFEIPKTADEIAYEALERLKAKKLPASGKIKEYYFELSDIARNYLENRFSLRAPEMTTEEFLYSLRHSDSLNASQKNALKQFLSHCDLVKFAKYIPTEEEIEKSFHAAKKLVDETKPVGEEKERGHF